MNAIQSFFQKYNAVPANDVGPQWERATDDALIGWAVGQAEAWDKNPGEQGILRSRMADIGNELWTRMDSLRKQGKDDLRDENHERTPYCKLLGAWDGIFRRIGYQWAKTA